MHAEAPVCLCFEEMLGFCRLSVQPLPLGLLRPDSGLERINTRPARVHSALPGASYAEGHLRGPAVISSRQLFLLFPQRVAGRKAAG